jgi:hypothetical protein
VNKNGYVDIVLPQGLLISHFEDPIDAVFQTNRDEWSILILILLIDLRLIKMMHSNNLHLNFEFY